ncbi:MAG: hypothetical protein GWP69_03185 [Gammaproteobacteria bacterium]|jgi:hypothetical protein|nr:hypothetical protein [Gammaproteobacteria bacterium]
MAGFHQSRERAMPGSWTFSSLGKEGRAQFVAESGTFDLAFFPGLVLDPMGI